MSPVRVKDFAGLLTNSNLTERGKPFLTASHQSQGSSLPYEVQDLAGKGKGVIAKRSIQQGEIFMVSFPAVVLAEEFERGIEGMSGDDRLQLYEVAFNRLANKQRALSLAASAGGHPEEDIMKTNAFGIAIGSAQYSALFPEIAVGFNLTPPEATAPALTSSLENKSRLRSEVRR
jgi:hypothetical protein